MKKIALIVAGGSGQRMNTATPKQFLPIAGKPILMHTIIAFHNHSHETKIFIILPSDYFIMWDDLCKQYKFPVKHTIVEGGQTRFHSVKNGLNEISACLADKDEESIIAIHDGVRPLIRSEEISKLFQFAEKHGNAVPAITINESVREITGIASQPVNRKNLRIIQTPQCFKFLTLQKAYSQNYREDFTDDANVVQSTGKEIHLTEGNINNIKITEPTDLIIAEALLHGTSKN